jgi:orotidine-5'-phosphate decarboxylase
VAYVSAMERRTASRAVRDVTPIVALDVPDESAASDIVTALDGLCQFYKVGPELFTATGTRSVDALTDRGCRVFLDLKFHDIPNTVRAACRSAARAGASLLTIHCSGGVDMMHAAVAGAQDGSSGAPCEVLAVTVLTSLDAARLATVWGRVGIDVGAEVVRLAGLACEAGVAGVVCGGGEAALVRSTYGEALSILVPGVRLAGSALDDQQRPTTPAAAAAAGADYVVVGRTVTGAADARGAMERVLREVGASRR